MSHDSILIADDERFVREVCVRAAREDGYQITTVASGVEAVDAARKQHFDLFLTDLCMPGMTGLEAYQEIVKMHPEIIGMAMTGYATMESAIQALQLGFHDFILKPFSPNDVREAIGRALERRRLREENARLQALIPFYQLTRALMSITSLDELLKRVMELAHLEAHADAVAILLFDRLNTTLTVRAASGLPNSVLGTQMPSSHAGFGRAQGEPHPLIWTREEIRQIPFASDVHTLITMPLVTQGQTLGMMVAGNRSSESPFSNSDIEMLSVLGVQAAVAIKNAQLFEEIEHAYKKVEESDFLKSEFIAIASHELRTPLVSILGYIELLTYGAQGDNLEQLNIVLEQALHLRDVVNDMLSLTDLQAGMTELLWAEISLHELLEEVARQEQGQMAAKGINLVVQIPQECDIIHSDYERIKLITSKLLSNAIKFSPQGGEVTIQAHRQGEKVVISITDQGSGIAKEAQERLFQPFYQVEESLRRSHGGMGLGLAIAKGMVELHGGEIWIESEEGKGSTFCFSIPQPEQGR